MKLLEKMTAVLLSAALIVTCIPASPVSAAAGGGSPSAELNTYDVPVVAADFDEDTVTFYEKDGRYYADVRDIAVLSGFTAQKSNSGYTLTRGVRKETAETGGTLPCISYQGLSLCEAVPSLKFLGAKCSAEDGYLAVYAPAFTIWDAIMPDCGKVRAGLTELHGDHEKAFLTMDVLLDLWDLNGDLVIEGKSYYAKKALYEILDVEPFDYDSVKTAYAEENARHEKALSYKKLKELTGDAGKAGDYITGALKKYKDYVLGGYMVYQTIERDDLAKRGWDLDAAEISLDIQDAVYQQEILEEGLSDAEGIFSAAKFGLDVAVTFLHQTAYDNDTRCLFEHTTGDDVIYLGIDAPEWTRVAEAVQSEINTDKGTILATTVASKAVDCALKFSEGLLIKEITVALGTPAKAYLLGKKLGDAATHFLYKKTYEGFSGDIEAVFVRKVQLDAYKMVGALLSRLADSGNTDAECLTHLKSVLSLYYRSVIAYSEDAKKSVEANSLGNSDAWIKKFDADADYAAGYLYRLSSCTVEAVPDYAALKDDVLKEEWMSRFLSAVRNNGGTVISWHGGIWYWKYTASSFKDTSVTGLFQQGTGADNTLVRRDADGKETEVYKGPGFGRIFISGGRIFFETIYTGFASIKADGSDKKGQDAVNIKAADEKRGLVVYTDSKNGTLCCMDKNLQSQKIDSGVIIFLAMGSGIVYYCKENGSRLTVFACDLTGDSPGEPKTLGTIETGIAPGGFMQKAICAHLGTSVLFVSCGGEGGTGFVYSGGGLSAVALDGSGVRTLVKPGSADSLQYDEFFVANAGKGADKETVYYYHGGKGNGGTGTSTFLSGMAPWIDHDVYKVDPVSGTVSPADEILSPDGSFACKNGAVLARMKGGAEYTEVASADTLKAAGYENVGSFGEGRVNCVTDFNIVGDTVYMELQEMDQDNTLNMGWRPGFRRIRNRLYRIKPGSPMEAVYEY
jgi:hypothetical protein